MIKVIWLLPLSDDFEIQVDQCCFLHADELIVGDSEFLHPSVQSEQKEKEKPQFDCDIIFENKG